MGRTEFLDRLQRALAGGVNSSRVAENVQYYREYIDVEIKGQGVMRVPGWLILLIAGVIFLLIIGVVFSIISFLAPIIIPVLIVVLVINYLKGRK